MSERYATDSVVLRSSDSGRMWGVSVDRVAGEERIAVTELESSAATNLQQPSPIVFYPVTGDSPPLPS